MRLTDNSRSPRFWTTTGKTAIDSDKVHQGTLGFDSRHSAQPHKSWWDYRKLCPERQIGCDLYLLDGKSMDGVHETSSLADLNVMATLDRPCVIGERHAGINHGVPSHLSPQSLGYPLSLVNLSISKNHSASKSQTELWPNFSRQVFR